MATVFSNQAHLANIINCYKKQGFSKAIDDFGSGPAGGGDGGDTPVRDKAEMVSNLKMTVAETEHFVTIYNVDLNAIEAGDMTVKKRTTWLIIVRYHFSENVVCPM